MTYFRTKYGHIIDDNNQIIPMDESSPLYEDYVDYLKDDGEVLPSNVVFQEDLVEEALQIDLYYTGLISDLLRKHIEKLSIDNIPIPQDAIDERDRLRAECNQKLTELGVTNFSYRQQNVKL